MDYLEALDGMRKRHAARAAGQVEDALICVQHPPVYTLGKAGGRENIMLTDAELRAKGIKVYTVERGGDVTCHGPGQAVVYPVVDIRARRMGVRALVEAVAGALTDVLEGYGVAGAWDNDRPGVWTAGRKIAAVGMAVPQKVSMHGMALNVNTDLTLYDHINACGLHTENTSLSRELGREIAMDEVFDRLYDALCRRLRQAQGSLAQAEAAAASR